MFFAPPQVKSLSRYSEFGTHLQDKHFIIMLATAVVLHGVVITIMMLSPREEVLQIPVRVLNVKLGDIDTDVNPGDMPQMPGIQSIPSPAPAIVPANTDAVKSEQQSVQKSIRQEAQSAQSAALAAEIDKVQPKTFPTSVDKVWLPAKSYKKVDAQTQKRKQEEQVAADTLSQPKQYVRENDLAEELAERAAKEGKAGKGTGGGKEAIERYEQVISIWLAQHKTYPESAKSQGIEGDAVVRVRINRRGKILYYGIERSSGTGVIDEAVMAMVKASDPVPAVPEDYPDGNQLEFLIPVTYRLK